MALSRYTILDAVLGAGITIFSDWLPDPWKVLLPLLNQMYTSSFPNIITSARRSPVVSLTKPWQGDESALFD